MSTNTLITVGLGTFSDVAHVVTRGLLPPSPPLPPPTSAMAMTGLSGMVMPAGRPSLG